MPGGLFKGIKQWELEWGGFKARFPVFYYDNTSLTAIYTASTRNVRELLPHPDMTPVELSPGRCLAAFTAFEYRKTDIGPYNEFSVAFVITFKKRQVPWVTAMRSKLLRRFSAYVWQLPVTTEMARVGGVKLYGYPKFLADIVFERGNGWIACTLSEKGERILRLKGKVLGTGTGKVSRFVTYSVIEGIPLVANVVVDPIEHAETRDGGAAALELGGHAISDALRKIGLSEKPIIYQYSPVTEAILFGGRNLMDR